MFTNQTFREKFTGDMKSRMEFLSSDLIPAFFIEVDINGQDIYHGNNRTRVSSRNTLVIFSQNQF